ncbi:hypothetical protein BDZ85DRAFT_196102 [Elsinoe ampelina]|uniref:F-box domain-containing protein n=1 Tax=Elsinoe ampelina TaxID=302913 RepID=A0A6A6GF10_9PEZI|nr:hypothetical protein BDZ85DRAFT_196102 [Elsinoe ampelina]
MTNPSPSAAHLVLTTPELLELILSHLPPLQLLLTQRVSPLFHTLITTSPLLQTLLFFRPNWSLIGHHTTSKPGPRPLNNLMLRRVLSSGTYPTMTLRSLTFPDTDTFLAAKTHLSLPSCPITLPDPAREVTGIQRDLGLWTWTVNISLPSAGFLTPTSAIGYEHASWRRMLLCQPPATELHLCKRWRRAERPAVVVEGGVRMGDLVERAERGKGPWNEGFISSDRDWHLEGAVRFSGFLEERG